MKIIITIIIILLLIPTIALTETRTNRTIKDTFTVESREEAAQISNKCIVDGGYDYVMFHKPFCLREECKHQWEVECTRYIRSK
jgi:hypothetical protein